MGERRSTAREGAAAFLCPRCDTTVAKTSRMMVWARCAQCHGLTFRVAEGPTVLIAHESDRIAQLVGAALWGTGCSLIRSTNGTETRDMIERFRPALVILGVAVEGVWSFQLIERIKAEPSSPAIVLVASVFRRTAYKRRPSSLYGADDYVEQHHIGDMLPAKVRALLGLSGGGGDAAEISVDLAEVLHPCDHLPQEQMVRALARSIVSDIALYFEPEVRRVAAGEVSPTVQAALAEGAELLTGWVADASWSVFDPIGAAFDELLTGLRRVP